MYFCAVKSDLLTSPGCLRFFNSKRSNLPKPHIIVHQDPDIVPNLRTASASALEWSHVSLVPVAWSLLVCDALELGTTRVSKSHHVCVVWWM